MEFKCRACDVIVKYKPSHDPEITPPGWWVHDVDGVKVLLCDSCGAPSGFAGGVSPWVRAALRARGVPV